MSTGILESLSAQQLVDCDTAWDQGCIGGNPAFAYPYIIRHGLASEVLACVFCFRTTDFLTPHSIPFLSLCGGRLITGTEPSRGRAATRRLSPSRVSRWPI